MNNTSFVAVVTQTDCHSLVRNLCETEHSVASSVFPLYFLKFAIGDGNFVIGVSQISSFFSLDK